MCGGSCGRDARVDLRICRDLAVGRFGEALHLIDRHVAGNDEDGVVGRVVALVEAQRVLARQLRHLVLPADDRDAVRVREVERGVHLLVEPRAWVVLDARAALLDDHLPLRGDLIVGEAQVRHAVGLHLHQGSELLLGDALMVGGDVLAGEGVVLAAELGDDLGEVADGDLVGRLEHQVLEEVRDAGDALGLVGGADLVPNHVRDDRGAVIGDHHDVHAVRQLELGGARFGGGSLLCESEHEHGHC